MKSPLFSGELSVSCDWNPASSLEKSRLLACDIPDEVKSAESWPDVRLLDLDLSRPFFFLVCWLIAFGVAGIEGGDDCTSGSRS